MELNLAPAIRDQPPPGVSEVVSCAPHEGVARAVLAAFKFRRLVGLAPLIAGYMADLAGAGPSGTILVPVPAARARRRWRGFDPAAELAGEMSATDPRLDFAERVLVRHGSRRQRGRDRAARLGSPPEITVTGGRLTPGAPAGSRGAPSGLPGTLAGPMTLVDDVMTTGATLAACAEALAESGLGPVSAVTFTRRL